MKGGRFVGWRAALTQSAFGLVIVALLAGCAGAPPATPAGSPAATIELAAEGLAFDRDEITVPADAPFAIEFENRESAPHNVSIRGERPFFVGETFSGPDRRIYQVAPLPAGEYVFVCDLHPEMRGTVISQ